MHVDAFMIVSNVSTSLIPVWAAAAAAADDDDDDNDDDDDDDDDDADDDDDDDPSWRRFVVGFVETTNEHRLWWALQVQLTYPIVLEACFPFPDAVTAEV